MPEQGDSDPKRLALLSIQVSMGVNLVYRWQIDTHDRHRLCKLLNKVPQNAERQGVKTDFGGMAILF